MFTVQVYATDPEGGGRVQVASQQFDVLAKAELYAACEAHGLQGAEWVIKAELTVEQAVNVVKASRNRTIHIALCAIAKSGDAPPYLQLKAPLTVDALRACYVGIMVEVEINAGNLYLS